MAQDQPSRVPPTLVAALAADTGAIEPHTGKKSLIGIFHVIQAWDFPTQRYMALYFSVTDAEGFYPIRISFLRLGTTEEILGEITGELHAQSRHDIQDMLVPPPAPVMFPEAGVYEFRLFASDIHVGGLTIHVHQAEKR